MMQQPGTIAGSGAWLPLAWEFGINGAEDAIGT